MSVVLEEGTVLADRYEIEKILGQGGMGAVYLAEDSRIPDKKWAIKELWDFGDPSTRTLIQDQFQREASILATMDHPNLPRITDFFVDQRKKYLVMDYVEGDTLEKKLLDEGGPLDLDFVLDLGAQLLDVLEYLHGMDPPVIFRDLKPANIMITPGGKVKLVDFGIARIFTAGKAKDTVIMGTPGFAAPEQYGQGQSDARSDIYGFGATLYFCVTGMDPSDNPFHFEKPSTINDKVYPRLENTILKAVQMAPDERFSSSLEIKKYLFSADARTSDFSPDAEGTGPDPVQTKMLSEATAGPPELNFGSIKKGRSRRMKFVVNGNVQKANVNADRNWVRVYPNLVDGADPEVGVTVYTSSLNHGGKYTGLISVKGEQLDLKVPLKLEVEPKHLNFLSYFLAFAFTLLSLVPAIGLLGFFLNLVTYFSIPRGERKSLKIFFYVTLFATLFWVTVMVLWFGISQFGWFNNLIFK